MRISDWSSDVCSSDLRQKIDRRREACVRIGQQEALAAQRRGLLAPVVSALGRVLEVAEVAAGLVRTPRQGERLHQVGQPQQHAGSRSGALLGKRTPIGDSDRKSAVEGERVSVRIHYTGRRN